MRTRALIVGKLPDVMRSLAGGFDNARRCARARFGRLLVAAMLPDGRALKDVRTGDTRGAGEIYMDVNLFSNFQLWRYGV